MLHRHARRMQQGAVTTHDSNTKTALPTRPALSSHMSAPLTAAVMLSQPMPRASLGSLAKQALSSSLATSWGGQPFSRRGRTKSTTCWLHAKKQHVEVRKVRVPTNCSRMMQSTCTATHCTQPGEACSIWLCSSAGRVDALVFKSRFAWRAATGRLCVAQQKQLFVCQLCSQP